MTSRHKALALATSLSIAVAACGSQAANEANRDEPQPQRGAELYADNCASCHGADLRGTDKGPSHLSIVYEPNHHSDDSFRRAIANGAPQHHWNFGDMEPIQGLNPDDVDAIITFVRAEQERRGFDDF